MPSEFTLTRTVEFSETDMAGLMHFANFFRWMEATETAFHRALGLPLISFVPGEVVGWPRVNATCSYRAPLRFGDTVEVRLVVKELRTRAAVYVFQFRKVVAGRPESGLCALGEIAAVCVGSDGRGGMVAQPLPETFRTLVCAAPPAAWSEV